MHAYRHWPLSVSRTGLPTSDGRCGLSSRTSRRRFYCVFIADWSVARTYVVRTRQISNERLALRRRRSYNWLSRHLIDVCAIFRPFRWPSACRSPYTLSWLAGLTSSAVILYCNRQTVLRRMFTERRICDSGRVEKSVVVVVDVVCVYVCLFGQ